MSGTKRFLFGASVFALLGAAALLAQQTGGGGVTPAGKPFSAGGTVTAPVYFPDGSLTVPSIAWTSDVGGVAAGFYRPGAGRIGWTSSGAERVEVGSDYIQVPVASARLLLNSTTFKQDSTSGYLLSGTAPTITGAFGTSNSINGTNGAFVVNVGTSPATSGTVTFAGTWTNAPMCVGGMASNTAADQRTIGIVTTTTTAVVSFAVTSTLTAPTASTSVVVHCVGR